MLHILLEIFACDTASSCLHLNFKTHITLLCVVLTSEPYLTCQDLIFRWHPYYELIGLQVKH